MMRIRDEADRKQGEFIYIYLSFLHYTKIEIIEVCALLEN